MGPLASSQKPCCPAGAWLSVFLVQLLHPKLSRMQWERFKASSHCLPLGPLVLKLQKLKYVGHSSGTHSLLFSRVQQIRVETPVLFCFPSFLYLYCLIFAFFIAMVSFVLSCYLCGSPDRKWEEALIAGSAQNGLQQPHHRLTCLNSSCLPHYPLLCTK